MTENSRPRETSQTPQARTIGLDLRDRRRSRGRKGAVGRGDEVTWVTRHPIPGAASAISCITPPNFSKFVRNRLLKS